MKQVEFKLTEKNGVMLSKDGYYVIDGNVAIKKEYCTLKYNSKVPYCVVEAIEKDEPFVYIQGDTVVRHLTAPTMKLVLESTLEKEPTLLTDNTPTIEDTFLQSNGYCNRDRKEPLHILMNLKTNTPVYVANKYYTILDQLDINYIGYTKIASNTIHVIYNEEVIAFVMPLHMRDREYTVIATEELNKLLEVDRVAC